MRVNELLLFPLLFALSNCRTDANAQKGVPGKLAQFVVPVVVPPGPPLPMPAHLLADADV